MGPTLVGDIGPAWQYLEQTVAPGIRARACFQLGGTDSEYPLPDNLLGFLIELAPIQHAFVAQGEQGLVRDFTELAKSDCWRLG